VSTDQMKKKTIKPTTKTVPAEVWLDYVENEVETSFSEDLKLLLDADPQAQKTVKEITLLKANIKDTIHQLPGDDFFKNLQSKIMTSVEETHPQMKISPWHKHQKVMTAATAAMCVVFVGVLLTQMNVKSIKSKKSAARVSPEEQLISENLQKNNGFYDELLLVNQNDDDLVLDAMADRLSLMPEKQAAKLIEQMK
jgi:hypothetical protein